MAVHRTTVRLSEPGLAGSYVVAERRVDGSLVLQPERIEDVIDELAGRVLSEEEQEQMFGRLDAIAQLSEEPRPALDPHEPVSRSFDLADA